jgi:hypothetical protein
VNNQIISSKTLKDRLKYPKYIQNLGSDRNSDDHELHAHPFFDENTPQYYVDYFQEAPEQGFAEYRQDARWSRTTSSGSGLLTGDPTIITWSIVPDGTSINGFNGEQASDSDLVSFLGGIYGVTTNDNNYEDEIWFPLIESTFERWSELSGITYVYEPNDDGVPLAYNNGQIGVRGDVRIGGHYIDGNSGVLAYNFFPNNGDMVIDTGDNFYSNTGSNSLRLRNVLAHEEGHGFGLSHVESGNGAFLMEPYINTSFDGPQFDDILGAHRGYGDYYEGSNNNQGNDIYINATYLGSINGGGTITIGADASDTSTLVSVSQTDFVSIDDDSDLDWYSFTIAESVTIDVLLTPRGPTYNEGPQGGSQTSFNTKAQSDLSLAVFDTNGITLLDLANNSGIGFEESIFDLELNEVGEYYVRITGANDAAQMYQLDLIATALNPPNNDINLSISPLDAIKAEGNAGNTTFTFTVTRSGDLSGTTTVDWTVTGTDVDANDFGGSLPSGTVTFNANQTSQIITVNVSGDRLWETDENFTVNLSNASGVAQITNATATGTIANDDSAPGITVSPTSGLITTEDLGTASFDVVLDSQPSAEVVITVTSSDATEGTISTNSLTFNSTNWNIAQTVTVTGVNDAQIDGDRPYSIVLDASSSDSSYNQIDPEDVLVTNQDNDFSQNGLNFNNYTIESYGGTSQDKNPAVTIEDNGETLHIVGNGWKKIAFPYTVTADTILEFDFSSSVEGEIQGIGFDNDNGLSQNFTFQLYGNQTWGISNYNDYGVESGNWLHYSIPVGQFYTGKMLYLTFANDHDVANPNGESLFSNLQVYEKNAVDNLNLSISPLDAIKAEGNAGNTTFTFTVTRSGDLSGTTTVDWTVTGTDVDANDFGGSLPSGTVTFNANQTSQIITVNVSGDRLWETDENFTVNLSNASGVAQITNATATGTIANDDSAPGITVSPTSGLITTEDLGTASFDVVLDSQPSAEVVITVTSSDATEGTISTNSLTFNSTNWNIAQTVTVTGVNDAQIDGDRPYSIVLDASSSDSSYNQIDPEDVLVTNQDNDFSQNGLNFNDYTIESYGGTSQDKNPVVTREDNGETLHIVGNGWKKIAFPYTVTADTILEFDFSSSAEGEIQGIGFDNDNGLSQNFTFQLYGTQTWGISNYNDYGVESGNWKHYSIPVGQFYTGKMLYLTFANDHDVTNPNGESLFSNLQVYEKNALQADSLLNDALTGMDVLTGTTQPDTFILGNLREVFYQNQGNQDYGLIRSLNLDEDKIQLRGKVNDYFFDASPLGLTKGMAIYQKVDRELIGIVEGITELNAISHNQLFSFVNSYNSNLELY